MPCRRADPHVRPPSRVAVEAGRASCRGCCGRLPGRPRRLARLQSTCGRPCFQRSRTIATCARATPSKETASAPTHQGNRSREAPVGVSQKCIRDGNRCCRLVTPLRRSGLAPTICPQLQTRPVISRDELPLLRRSFPLLPAPSGEFNPDSGLAVLSAISVARGLFSRASTASPG
jgi:hypothetical protein